MGITDISKIFLIALIIFFHILVVVRDEAANLHPELILSVRSLGAGRRALFRYVYFPASLPAVLTALEVSVVGARKQGVPVSVCGEMAGDPLGALLLLGAGVDRLSMATGSIPRVKRIIRSFSTDEAHALWKSALDCGSAQRVREVLAEALEDKGLGGLIRPGR